MEGTGSATITNISTELLPNREIFQEIYPDDESDSDEAEESESEESEDEKDSDELVAVREKLAKLHDEQRAAREKVASAEARLKFLDAYGKMLDRKRDVAIADGVETYRTEREKVFADSLAGAVRERELAREIAEVVKTEAKLVREAAKAREKREKIKAKARKAREKEKEKERRKLAERRKERARIRKERQSFWPKQVYTVRISLDASVFTPMTSRRNSIASDMVKLAIEKAPAGGADDVVEEATPATCDLTLTYVTGYAYWTPNYDLSLSTTTNTGTLCFDAQLTNLTSEAWNNCKVILSTSQTDFSSLNDTIPTLQPWRVKIGPRGAYHLNDIMDSREERAQKQAWQAKQNNVYSQKNRIDYFGVDLEPQAQSNKFSGPPQPPPMQMQANFAATSLNRIALSKSAVPQAPRAASLRGAAPGQSYDAPTAPATSSAAPGLDGNAVGFDLYAAGLPLPRPAAAPVSYDGVPAPGAAGRSARQRNELGPAEMKRSSAAPVGSRRRTGAALLTQSDAAGAAFAESNAAGGGGGAFGGFFGGVSKKEKRKGNSYGRSSSFDAEGGEQDEEQAAELEPDEDDEGRTIGDGLPPELGFAESSFEETGLTTTFDLPGLKSLVPSSTASRQRVARVSFTGVVFNHTVVAKYTPAAYLRARLRNASKLTILKGPAGLTLDGSFLGRTTLPRCSAGDSFSLSLGIDPAVKVAYPKPDVKRSTTGIISKEDSSVYTRTITITNTRSGPVPATASPAGAQGAAGSSSAAAASAPATRPPISLTVLDQVPISEDARLRIDLLYPRGLTVKGAPVPAGVPGKETGKDGKEVDSRDWGRATATLKKGGEVCWDVTLNPGRSVKLQLEYEVALPAGEVVQQVTAG